MATTLTILACKPTISEQTCKSFRVGKFAFRPTGGPAGLSYLIDRNDSIQTETEEQTGYVTTLRVKWVNSCTYQLSYLSSTKVLPESVQRLRKAVPLTTEIMAGNERYYIFRSQRTSVEPIFVDTIWVRH
ncbi:hypothetical protein [Hymenobacter endophyticus]|uniref:Uncharacterized protein n=1 Tax=Hymenobacter endophyticus TaxID=3076335 RepID=A0ABU3TGM2_9BACT|nr:hypothetical protein [Hymenobacter endophyticus]MDU0370490.1 hypothetical protein [Hymenobacter endophyticus]